MEQTSAGALEFSIQRENAQEQRFSIGFPSDSVVKKKSACSARAVDSIPGSEESPGGGHGNPLQHSYLENPMDRGARWATAHRVTKMIQSQTPEAT